MAQLLKRFADIDKLSCNILIELIFEAHKEQCLYLVLKSADLDSQNEFFQVLDDFERQWFEARLKDLPMPEAAEVEAAEAELEQVFALLEPKLQELEKLAEKNQEQMLVNRSVMKANFIQVPGLSDQLRGIPMPNPTKPYPETDPIIVLPPPSEYFIKKRHIFTCLRDRKSRRSYTTAPMRLEELSYLLWATQGVKEVILDGKLTLRTVPSAGARHALETYLVVMRVAGLAAGIYHYLPLKHAVRFVKTEENLAQIMSSATFGQEFAGNAAVAFIWSAIPYRSEWRYTVAAQKLILVEAGHICQNLYLACESINYGTCAVAAYAQQPLDELLGLDGDTEFVVYLAAVGKIREAVTNEPEV